ncbi:uncharacterized protein BJ171DRAFT_61922 [Polychytrium aggregatum]|uniref:uncharacterized protein n=1 Tax=Polychytrium aggregatum TaxID=110093 RepID=UPI0022FDCAC3|nr:uncharacterized protein BJ171DRAFT_61922 [Polychytrium aggregatum]KAI9205493.1 hypothetical protein BJ171DRAFT_61922 [Polychytrium aggregatum]
MNPRTYRGEPLAPDATIRNPFGYHKRKFPETQFFVVATLHTCLRVISEFKADLIELQDYLQTIPEYPYVQRCIDIDAALLALQSCVEVFPKPSSPIPDDWKFKPHPPPPDDDRNDDSDSDDHDHDHDGDHDGDRRMDDSASPAARSPNYTSSSLPSPPTYTSASYALPYPPPSDASSSCPPSSCSPSSYPLSSHQHHLLRDRLTPDGGCSSSESPTALPVPFTPLLPTPQSHLPLSSSLPSSSSPWVSHSQNHHNSADSAALPVQRAAAGSSLVAMDSSPIIPGVPSSSSDLPLTRLAAKRPRYSPAANLPEEILRHILFRFGPSGYRPYSSDLTSRESHYNLASCSLVNRWWNQVATQMLWQVPVLWSPECLEKFSMRCIWYLAELQVAQRLASTANMSWLAGRIENAPYPPSASQYPQYPAHPQYPQQTGHPQHSPYRLQQSHIQHLPYSQHQSTHRRKRRFIRASPMFRPSVQPLYHVREMRMQFHSSIPRNLMEDYAMTPYRQRISRECFRIITQATPNLSRICVYGFEVGVKHLEHLFVHCPNLMGVQCFLNYPAEPRMEPTPENYGKIAHGIHKLEVLDLGQIENAYVDSFPGQESFWKIVPYAVGPNLRAIEVSESPLTPSEMAVLFQNAPNIVVLDVNSCPNLDDSFFRIVLKMLPRLETLIVYPNWSLTDEGFADFCQDAQNLRILELDMSDLDPALVFRGVVECMPRIQSLALGTCNYYEDQDDTHLFAFLGTVLPRLRVFQIGIHAITNSLLMCIGQYGSQLRSLRLDYVDEKDEMDEPPLTADTLRSALAMMPHLFCLSLTSSDGDEIHPEILENYREASPFNVTNSYFVLRDQYMNDY